MRPLDDGEKQRRARHIKLVLTDVDGVLTDGTVAYSVHGEELRNFSVRDGWAVEALRAAGIETAFLLHEPSPMVLQRARKLHVKYVFTYTGSKAEQLGVILTETGVNTDEIAYVGDDVDDLDLLRRIGETGLTAVPSNAVPEASALAYFVSEKAGGHGALRAFADQLLEWRRSS